MSDETNGRDGPRRVRIGDAERERVLNALQEHLAAGRLTVDEYDERLARAYTAKTYGELAELTADLPRTPTATPARSPRVDPPEQRQPAAACAPGGDLRSAWRAWATTSLIVLTIWLATSAASWELLYFWPVWVFGPWGAVLLARTLAGGWTEYPRPTPGGRR